MAVFDPNVLLGPPRGDPWNDDWGDFLDRLYMAQTGEEGRGLQQIYTAWDGLTPANVFSSADPTNGIGIFAYSQDESSSLQISNDGNELNGPWFFTGDGEITGDVDITGDLGLIGNADIDGTLHVTGATTLDDILHVIGAGTFDATLDATGDFKVNTNKFVVTAASGNVAFPGNLAINGAKFTVAGSSGNTLIAGTATITGDIINDTTTFVTNAADNKVGVGVAPASTSAMFEVKGTTFVTDITGLATTGAGVETVYVTGLGLGQILAIDRAGAGTFKILRLDGSEVRIGGATTRKIGFYNSAGTTQQSAPSAVSTGTADATYGTAERDSINEHSVAINDIITKLKNTAIWA